MPNVNVIRDALFERIGENWGAKPFQPCPEADKAFDELCFEFGIELDDVTSEKEMQLKETGVVSKNASTDIIYVIAVPANRYDLLCIEGLSRALRIFMGKEVSPAYKLIKNPNMHKMIVRKEVQLIRPHVVCAILRNIHFTEQIYNSFIDLQDKLHQNIGRRRTLVSIGTHDLDSISGPFYYEAHSPKNIKFAPLNHADQVMDAVELFAFIEKNAEHLKPYLGIIEKSPVYPVIKDSKGVVLSLPPIINGDHSKITLNTKNVLIEVTATDLTKANITLNTICAMFSEYCSDKFSVEAVQIEHSDGNVTITPDLSERSLEANIDYITTSVGVKLEPDTIATILGKMSLSCQLNENKSKLKVSVPCTRSDVIHACDVMEDVAIAYGYNKLERISPKTVTQGKQQLLNKVSDFIRKEVAFAGYSEVLTLSLCSKEENYKLMRRKEDDLAVVLANPRTIEFQIARTTLLVGLLKTIFHNKQASLPLKLFEVSDIVIRSSSKDVGATNKRNLAAIYCNAQTSGFEYIHGLLDRVMQVNKISWKEASKPAPKGNYYYLSPSEDPAFLPSARADVILNEQKIGVIGIVHPEVLDNYKIQFPCSAFEICVEQFI